MANPKRQRQMTQQDDKKENCQEVLLRGKAYKEEQSSRNTKKRVKFVDVILNLRCLQHPKGNEVKPL